MKIFSLRSAVYLLSVLFFSTFSFALPMLEDSSENLGEEQQEKKQQELQVEQEERARMTTEDHDAAITEIVQRGDALPDVAEAPSSEPASQLAVKYDLAAAYSSSGKSRMNLPSISAMREKINSLRSMDAGSRSDQVLAWPMKEMTRLEADQEYNEALKFLKLNDKERVGHCSQAAQQLTSFYKLLWDDSSIVATVRPCSLEIYQKLISLSLLARSLEEVSKLSNMEEKNCSKSEQLVELQKNEDDLVQRRDQAATAWRLALKEYCDSKGGDAEELNKVFVSLSTDLDCLGVEWVAHKKNLATAIEDERAKKIQAFKNFIKINCGPNFGTSSESVLKGDEALTQRVNAIIVHFNHEPAAIYERMQHQIVDLKKQLEQLLPEEKKSGNEDEDVLFYLLEEHLKKINAAQAQEKWTEMRADLEFLETLKPFVQEKMEILKKLAEWEQAKTRQMEPNGSPVRYQVLGWEWNNLLSSLDKVAQLKLNSLREDLEGQQAYQEQQREFNDLKSRTLAQLEPAVLVGTLTPSTSESRFIFDNTFRVTLLLGSMTFLVAALAYEWHLHFLHSHQQATSS